MLDVLPFRILPLLPLLAEAANPTPLMDAAVGGVCKVTRAFTPRRERERRGEGRKEIEK
jgi:hypothetical protein